MNIENNLLLIRKRIDKVCFTNNISPKIIEILPVSKYQPIQLMKTITQLGFYTFGESYVQEGKKKLQQCKELKLTLIGHLQQNKAETALKNFHEIMTIDSHKLIEKLANIANRLNIIKPIWIQINLWNEATKTSGCTKDNVANLLSALKGINNLPIKGFMAIPPQGDKKAFYEMAIIRDYWQQALGQKLRLSMGMSNDFEEAIKHGSDHIRIGSALFNTNKSM